MVALRGGSPEAMFDQGIAALGGMTQFVKKGQKVVVKPNIGWNKAPVITSYSIHYTKLYDRFTDQLPFKAKKTYREYGIIKCGNKQEYTILE